MFSPKCGGCNRPVLENYLSAMDAVWHPECFVCGVRILTYLLEIGKMSSSSVREAELHLQRGFTVWDEESMQAFRRAMRHNIWCGHVLVCFASGQCRSPCLAKA